jgi:glutamate racemase
MRAMDSRAVGVFDSGVGGLTVLHECLVTMPNEDFVYLGDHARLPYGPRPLEEIRRFAREIGAYLEQQDVKLILVACNAATSAALPQLQEELTVPVVGVITPEAHAAVQATRNRRVGLLATAACRWSKVTTPTARRRSGPCASTPRRCRRRESTP